MSDLSSTGMNFEKRPLRYIEFALQTLGAQIEIQGNVLKAKITNKRALTVEVLPHGETFDLMCVTESDENQVWRNRGSIGHKRSQDFIGRFKSETDPQAFILQAEKIGLLETLEDMMQKPKGSIKQAMQTIPPQGVFVEPQAATDVHPVDYDYLGM